MNRIIVFLILVFSANQILYSKQFEFFPLLINFQGVEVHNDTIIAYGNYGSILIKYGNGTNWEQKKVFDKGTIINYFWNHQKMIAFNHVGNIGVSYDKGKTWNFAANLRDTILSVIKYPEGYFVRARDKLFSITDDFELKNEYNLSSEILKKPNSYFKVDYRRSIVYYKENLIVEIDSSSFVRFDIDLNPLDTLSFRKSGVFDSTYKYKSGYCLDTSSEYLYIKSVGNIKTKPNTTGHLVGKIFRTDNFQTVEEFYEFSAGYSTYRIHNDKFFPLNKRDDYLIDSTKLFLLKHKSRFSNSINDFTISDNKMTIVGDNKLIETINLQDSSLTVHSEFYKAGPSLLPDKIGNESFLFYSGGYNTYYPNIYRTDDNGITFKPTVDNVQDSVYANRYSTYTFRFKYFDEIEKKIYLGGNQGLWRASKVFISNDYCKTFTSKSIENLSYHVIPVYKNAWGHPNLQSRDDGFITSDGSLFSPWGTILFSINTYDKNFNLISTLRDSNFVFNYIHSADTNTFLIRGANVIDSTSEIRFTSNKGKTWETIHKFPIAQKFSYCKIIENNSQKLLALIHNELSHNPDDITYSVLAKYLDVIDLETNQFQRIYKWERPNEDNEDWGNYSINMVNTGNSLLLAIEDTLFYVSDIYDKDKWEYDIVPNNGKIVRPIKKFGDKYYCRYTDNDIPWSGNVMFWFTIKDTITSVINEIESQNYLYAYPPYPNPARQEVRAKIFWDISIDINNDDINVYDIFGLKVAGKERINIDKQTNYSGILTWDCSDVVSGIYFIQIEHGTKSWTLKVMVNR